MGTGYTRNDTGNNIADGNVINASDLDGEYNAIEAAFNASTGHTHDGTSAEGAPIEVAGPAQDLVITATEVRPKTDNTLDLGTTTLEFKDAFFDGTVKTDTLTVDENATVTGNLTVNGNTTLGNAATDTVTVTADVASDLIPSADGTYDLGASGSEWQDLYIDGTANIDSLVADTADINAGSIDGVTLGTNSAVTSAVITTADINGGSVDGATLGTNSAITEAQIDNININGNAITSTDTNGNIALTPDGTGEVDISKVDIDSGTIDSTTIGGSTPAAGSFTTITGSGDMNIDSGTLFVDVSADSVGIGTISPNSTGEETLHINASEYPTIHLTNSTTGTTSSDGVDIGINSTSMDLFIRNREAANILFSTSATERMRLDSSGNLIFNNTSANTFGVTLNNDNYIYIKKDGGISAFFDRQNSDGDIVEFRQSGSTVGSIGANQGDLNIGTGDTTLRFQDGNDAIVPRGTGGALRDGAIDLGLSNQRFKDLYLSGGVYLGGTGAANYLDDYEEGTWTPVITGSSTSGTVGYDNQIGKYTKIGNIVTVSCLADTGVVTVAPTGDLRVSGLPFNASSGNEFVGAVAMKGIPFPASTTTVSVITITSQSYVEFLASGDNVTTGRVQADNLATDDYIYFTLTYRV